MVEHIASTIALLALGILTLFAAWRGHVSGELVGGGFRGYRPNRHDNPLGYYFYLGIYIVAGTVWTVWGMLILMGLRRPLPWG
jgi:hypothetical protein